MVQLRSDATHLRRRFSIAHEVAHTLFYEQTAKGLRHRIGILSKEELAAEERICNAFASALLMPASRLQDSLVSIPLNSASHVLSLLDQTARRFQVSLPALVSRLNQVQLASSQYIVLCFRFTENQYTGRDARLRVDSHCL